VPKDEFIVSISQNPATEEFAYKVKKTLTEKIDVEDGNDVVSLEKANKILDMLNNDHYNLMKENILTYIGYSEED
jgi:predicted RNA-binding protein (virulence factor B family)